MENVSYVGRCAALLLFDSRSFEALRETREGAQSEETRGSPWRKKLGGKRWSLIENDSEPPSHSAELNASDQGFNTSMVFYFLMRSCFMIVGFYI